MDYCAAVFVSTHAAITAQRLLKGVCPFLTMPVLREISLGCGIALRFRPEELAAVRAALAASGLGQSEYALYGVTGAGETLRCEPLG